MIFDLAADFAAALGVLPQDHPKRRTLSLLDEAIRRDIHFIDRHPTTLFQCAWNTASWYDHQDLLSHYEQYQTLNWALPPWAHGSPVSDFMGHWRAAKEQQTPQCLWLRAVRPPVLALGGPQVQHFAVGGSPVSKACLSDNGDRVAAGCADGTVQIWERETGRNLLAFQAHTGAVCQVAFSPDSTHLFTACSQDCSVRVWRTDSGTLVREMRQEPAGHIVAFSPGLRQVAFGRLQYPLSADSMFCLEVLDVESNTIVATHLAFRDKISALSYSFDGSQIAVGAHDGTLALLDADSGAELKRFQAHQDWISCVACAPVTGRIVCASWDETFSLWDSETGRPLARAAYPMPDTTSIVSVMAISPDGQILLVAFGDATVGVFATGDPADLGRLRGLGRNVSSLSFSADGQTIVVGSGDGVHLLRMETAYAEQRLTDHHALISCSAFSPDGDTLATGSMDATVRLWDSHSGLARHVLDGHDGMVQTLAFSPDGRHLAAGSTSNVIYLWDTQTGELKERLAGHTSYVQFVAYSPDGRFICSGSLDNSIRVWDAASGAEAYTITGHTGIVGWVAMLSDCSRLISASKDGTIRVWDTASHVELLRIDGYEQAARSVALANSEQFIVAAAPDNTVRVWQMADGAETQRLGPHTGFVWAVAISDDDTIVATASSGETRVWEIPSGRCLALIEGRADVHEVVKSISTRRPCLISGDVEMRARPALDAREVGWLPGRGANPVGHPHRTMWAGVRNHHLDMVELEGNARWSGPPSHPHRGPS